MPGMMTISITAATAIETLYCLDIMADTTAAVINPKNFGTLLSNHSPRCCEAVLAFKFFTTRPHVQLLIHQRDSDAHIMPEILFQALLPIVVQ